MKLPDPAASRAVLIGVDAYRGLEPLPSVANNLTGLTALLTGPDSWRLLTGNCEVLRNPTSAAHVLDVVRKAAREAEDAFLVYFAGHGLLSPEASLYLALRNSDRERLYHAVDYNQLRHQVAEECSAVHRVVLLDCCYSGRAMQGYLGSEVSLADCGAVDGTYLMAASGETRQALAPEGERYTAFTGEVLKAARGGVPDGPELLDMGAVFTHVRRELYAKNRPVPQQRARNGGQGIVLARNRWNPAPGPEATEYAAALRDVAERWPIGREADRGLLRGVRIAPKEFVDDTFGAVLATEELTRLHSLRRAAQAAAPDAATRLLYWREEVDLLRGSLEQAGEYSHRVESELAEAREQVRRLSTEVKVLRRQVEGLLRAEERRPVETAVRAEEAGALVGTGAAVRPVSATAGSTRTATGVDGTREERTEREERAEERAAAKERAEAVERVAAMERAEAMDEMRREEKRRNAAAPFRELFLWGGCGILLALGAVIYLVCSAFTAVGDVSLEYDSGRKPASSKSEDSEQPVFVWDVAERAESTFRPAETDPTDTLLGDLTVSVTKECTDRTVHWEITADGVRVNGGSLTGKREHRVALDHEREDTAKKVTLTTRWDGGDTTCGSFGVVLRNARMAKSFHLLG
ncbi:caspase family protein [Streptomyces sp. NPDC002643]